SPNVLISDLESELENANSNMYAFWKMLNERKTSLTDEEREIAQGKKKLNAEELTALLKKYSISPLHQQTLQGSLARAADSNQTTFQRLLIEWLIVCDQPFSEVERPEFKALLQYVHFRSVDLKIPS
ncbi:hypothetical protein GGX14DRAFT_320845, partial [Mycena pura]